MNLRKIKLSNIICVCIVFMIIYALTYDTVGIGLIWAQPFFILIFGIPVIILIAQNIKKHKWILEEGLWLFFVLLVIMRLVLQYGITSNWKQYNYVWISSCLLITLLSNYFWWQKTAFNTFLIVSIIHVALGWYYFILPSQYDTDIISRAGSYSNGLKWLQGNGVMLGIANHYSVTGIYFSIAFLSVFILAYIRKKKILWFLDFILFISLFLTQKRGMLVAATLTVLITYILLQEKSIKTLVQTYVKIIGVILGIFASVIVLANTKFPEMTRMFLRIANAGAFLEENRLVLWIAAFRTFLNNPILGIGWNVFSLTTGYQETCNSYLEVFAALGIVGGSCFLVVVFLTFLKTINLMKKVRKNGKMDIEIKKLIIFSFAIQLYFIIYSLSGEAIILIDIFFPYFLCCSIALYMDKKVVWENEEER